MPETPTPLHEIIAEHIRTHGPVTFAWFMETALYHPELGYYRQPERKPGRGGDFITSPEIHPFFGFTLANQIALDEEAAGAILRSTLVNLADRIADGSLPVEIAAVIASRECLGAERAHLIDAQLDEHRPFSRVP